MNSQPDSPDAEIKSLYYQLREGMISYMNGDDFDCGYTQRDVDRCMVIVDQYLENVAGPSHGSDESIEIAIKLAVLSLNELNRQCGGALIETDQREDLCEIILLAARANGLTSPGDITQALREW